MRTIHDYSATAALLRFPLLARAPREPVDYRHAPGFLVPFLNFCFPVMALCP